MIIFYPRDIEMWRKSFNFNTTGVSQHTKIFDNREQLIEFLVQHKVRIDDERYPLYFEETTNHHCLDITHTIIQALFIGYMKETIDS